MIDIDVRLLTPATRLSVTEWHFQQYQVAHGVGHQHLRLDNISAEPAGAAGPPPSARKAALALFEGDEADDVATKQTSTISRRKKQQLASETQKQVDKYAVETELDITQIQELDDGSHLNLTGQVRMRHTCACSIATGDASPSTSAKTWYSWLKA